MLWTIELPWPPRDCASNARGHWAKRARAAKQYRRRCQVLTRQAMTAAGVVGHDMEIALEEHGHLDVWLAFYPPDRRHRDDDNVEGAFKSGRDGMADMLGVDDRHFRTHRWIHRDQPRKGGAVLVTITAGQVAATRMVLPAAGE